MTPPVGASLPKPLREPDARTVEAVSILVAVTERPSRLQELYEEFATPFRRAGLGFEFVFIVEPEHWHLVAPLEELRTAGEPIRILRVGQAAGETALLRTGAEQAAHDVFLTLPAYPRIEADALLDVLEPVLRGASMSVARRWPRRDSWLNRLQNRIFHILVASAAGGHSIHDVACGVRAIRRDVFESLPMYGDFHRFLPFFALRQGYRVEEVEAPQHVADHQPRVYSLSVYLRRVLDVFGLYFLMRFTEKPLRFFGLIGAVSLLAGSAILAVLALQRFQGQPLADRPILLLGVLLLVLGVQAVALGLIGEIIVHVNTRRVRVVQEIRRDPGLGGGSNSG
jgi:hypothetical protein